MTLPNRAPVRVMAHLVAGYPDDSLALAAADGLAAGGVSAFEVQLPFSDPSADGVAIQTACAEVLSRGYRVARGLAFVGELKARYPEIPAFIMTYANLAWKAGIERFADLAAKSGAKGLIVPDLPFDSDEGLAAACAARGLVSVPVAAPSMTPDRIAALAALDRPLVYAALRAGITGSETRIDAETLAFLASLEGSAGTGDAGQESRVLGGFGIRNGEQAARLAPRVHAVVAGSVFVELIRGAAPSGADAVREAVRKKAAELSGFGQ